MKSILELIERKKQIYAQLPLFTFMADTSLDPRKRLAFAPCMAHFIMSFGDLNKYVFRNNADTRSVQQLVNEHTYEDDHHYPWFLTDLNKLGFNTSKGFVDTLRFLWGDDTPITRQLSYQLAAYTFNAEPIYKVAVIEAIEATGNILFSLTSKVAQELQALNQQEYQYFGQFHFNLENGHAAKSCESEQLLESLVLTEAEQRFAIELVEKVFDIFTAWTDELLAYAQKEGDASQLSDSQISGNHISASQFVDSRSRHSHPTTVIYANDVLNAS
ncbi:hypothetical protein [Alkalinema sp. FACHB-956]|uniref:hypothetical protein n=1 Tax=Alkalinema sp. FACHB-956 TaxID=2692768 RepID=UPI00168576D4|nr:hypothetical protein [Alkalinema sp. FACHB-956]MBD2326161.1 hypothetical protein [Alkalinema sp. FACHB-956]